MTSILCRVTNRQRAKQFALLKKQKTKALALVFCFFMICDPLTWLSEQGSQSDYIKNSIKSLQLLVTS